jgi:hypothetical protein
LSVAVRTASSRLGELAERHSRTPLKTMQTSQLAWDWLIVDQAMSGMATRRTIVETSPTRLLEAGWFVFGNSVMALLSVNLRSPRFRPSELAQDSRSVR